MSPRDVAYELCINLLTIFYADARRFVVKVFFLCNIYICTYLIIWTIRHLYKYIKQYILTTLY